MGVVCLFDCITSKENATIKYASKLLDSAKFRKENKQFILEGFRLCNDAAENGYVIDTVFVSETAKEKLEASLTKLLSVAKRKILIPDKLLHTLSDTVNSQGVICIVDFPSSLLPEKDLKCGKYVALENTQDPANLGTIARTAEALGVDGLILSKTCCDVFSPKVQRAGMGTLLRLPILFTDDFVSTLKDLKDKNFTIYSSVINGYDAELTEVEFNQNSVLLIGNEANGLTEEAKGISDLLLTIKMKGKAESLNAASAASILMWKMMN